MRDSNTNGEAGLRRPTGNGVAPAGSSAQEMLDRLPKPIVEKLRLLIRRIRSIVLLRGVLIVAATAMGLILTLMAIDASVVMLPQPVQAGLSICALLATVAVAWRVLFRPLMRKHTLVAIARVLENRHPQLEERISSAIDLLGSPDPAAMKGSELLIAELVKAAEIDASTLSPKMEFTIRSARPYLIAVSAMAGVVCLLFLLWPQSISRLLTRALVPYANVGNMSSTLLTVTPGNARIAIGEELTITAAIQVTGMSRAELRFTGEKGSETIERMGRDDNSPVGISAFTTKFPAVEASFRYRVRIGNALSGYYMIRVERRPEVEHFKVAYDYPAYSGLPPRSDEGTPPGDIIAPAGTSIKLSARFNKPLAVTDLIVNGKPMEAGTDSKVDGKSTRDWSLTLARGLDTTWSFNLVDDMGMTNRRVDNKIQAIADAIPTVELSEPISTTLKLKPTELVPISYFARDDYGIQAACMFVTIDNGKASVVDLSPPARNDKKRELWAGEGRLNLASLDLATAKKVSVRIAVADNMPVDMVGPQTGFSQVVSIELDQQALALSRQTVALQEAEIRANLAIAKAKLEAARKKAPTDDEQARGVEPKLPDIKEIHQLSGDAEDILRKLAVETGESSFAQLARPLTDIADNHVEPAKKSAEMIPLSDNVTDRDKNVTSMKKNLDAAIAALNALSPQIEKAKESAQALADMKDLANQQEQLAKDAQALANKPKAANKEDEKKWKEAQDEVLKKVADMVKKDPEALDKQAADSQKAAQDLADAAKALADQQKALADQGQKSDSAKKQQSEIAKKTEDLKDDAGRLAAKMEKVGDPKAKNADEAKQDVQSAGEKMKSAMDKMATPANDNKQAPSKSASPPPPNATDKKPENEQQAAQQQASQQLTKAADKLADLAKPKEGDMKGIGKPAKPGESKTPSPAGAKTPNAGSPAPGKGAGSKGQGEGGGKPGDTPSPGKTKGGPPGPGGETPGAPGGEKPGPGTGTPDGADSLAKAFDKAADAASADSMSQAAPSAAQAAQALDQLASATAQKMGMKPGSPGGKPGKPGSGPPGSQPSQSPNGSGVPADGEQGLAGGNWLQSKGTLSGNVRDSSEDNTAPDYRDLVKSYFRSVAREGDKPK